MLDWRRFSSGGGRSAAESRRLAWKDWGDQLPAGVEGRLERRNNATWFLPLISRGPGCPGNHSTGPNISAGCIRSFRKRAQASFHLWGGIFYLFFPFPVLWQRDGRGWSEPVTWLGNTEMTSSRRSGSPEAAIHRPLSHWFLFHYSLCIHLHLLFTIYPELLDI